MKNVLAIAFVFPLLLVALWMPTSGQSAEPAISGAALEYKDGETMDQEEEYDGADLSIHKISATPDREVSW